MAETRFFDATSPQRAASRAREKFFRPDQAKRDFRRHPKKSFR